MLQFSSKVNNNSLSTSNLSKKQLKLSLLLADAGARNEDILLVPLDMVKYEDHEQAFNKVLQYFGKVTLRKMNSCMLSSYSSRIHL
jgi:hypothetical protein